VTATVAPACKGELCGRPPRGRRGEDQHSAVSARRADTCPSQRCVSAAPAAASASSQQPRSLVRRLQQQLSTGERSSLEITEAYLAAIEASQPTLNAFSSVCGDVARAHARAADARRAAGAVLGPLDGIPVSVKVRVPPWRARDAPGSPRRATGQHLHAQCHHQRRQPHPGGLCASLRRHFVRAAGGTGVRAAWQDEHGRVWHGIKHRAKRLRSNR